MKNTTTNKVLFGISFFILAISAWYFSDVLAYIIIAAVVSFLLTPLVNKLDNIHYKEKYFPRWLATIIAMLTLIAVFVGIGFVFIPLLIHQVEVLTKVDYQQLAMNLQEPLHKLELWFIKLGVEDPEAQLQSYIQETASSLVSFTQVGDLINIVLGLTGNVVIGFFAVTFITFFFLKDEHLVKRIILGTTPDAIVDKVATSISNSKKILSRYFLGLLIQVSLISTLVTLGLTIMGVENALLIGFFAGIINVIPYIGPIFGIVFGLFVAITTNLDVGASSQLISLLSTVLIVFLIVQMLDNFVFQPLIFANSVKAHPLEIFILIFIAGKLAGIIGMICAIPAYSLIRIFAKEFLTEFKIVKNLTKNL